MRKTLIAAVLAVVMALGFAFGIAGLQPASVSADSGTKTLTNYGDVNTGALWRESGAPDSWPGAVESISIDGQADGGDVILRNELNGEGTGFIAGETGFAREGIDHNKAAYVVNGLQVKFYLSNKGSNTLRFIFTQNSGWYGGSTYSFWLTFDVHSNTASANYTTKGGNPEESVTGGGSEDFEFYTDYDYFADKEAGFPAQAPVGTLNTMEIRPSGGALTVFVNGAKAISLPEIETNCLPQFNNGMAFLCLWNQSGTGELAMRVTDINENADGLQTSGCAEGWSFVGEEEQAAYGYDNAARLFFQTKGENDHDFRVQYDTPLYFSDLTLRTTPSGLAAGDVFNYYISSESGEDGTYLKLSFTVASAVNTANLAVSMREKGEQEVSLGTAEGVDFLSSGSTNNTLALKETVALELSFNNAAIDIDLGDFSALKSSFTDEKAYIQYEVVAAAEATLRIDEQTGSQVTTLDSYDGYVADADTTIKQDGDYGLFYTESGDMQVRNVGDVLIADSFGIDFKIGKYAGNTGTFEVAVANTFDAFYGEEDAALVFTLSAGSDATHANLAFSVYDKGNVTEIGTGSVQIDWNYGTSLKIGFCNDGGEYLVYANGALAILVADDKTAAVDAAVSQFEGNRGCVQFTAEGDPLTAFAMTGYDLAVTTTSFPNWVTGATGTSLSFGYNKENHEMLVFDGGSVIRSGKACVLDGFEMEFKTFVKPGFSSPQFLLANSTQWYSNGVAVAFNVSAGDDDATATVGVQVTDKTLATGIENSSVGSNEVAWNWNNDEINTISVVKNDEGVWEIYFNEVLFAADEDQSETLQTTLNNFVKVENYQPNTAFAQAWSGSNCVWEIVSMSETNTAPTLANQKFDPDGKYVAGQEITLDLDGVFEDVDNDPLTYDADYGEVTDGVWKFTPDEAGDYEVIITCYDGRGGSAEYIITFTAEAASVVDPEDPDGEGPGTEDPGKEPGTDPAPSGDAEGCAGCSGNAGVAVLALGAALAGCAAVLLFKKRQPR